MDVYRGGHDALTKDPRAQNITFLTISPSVRANLAGGSIRLPNVVGMPYLTRTHWTQHSGVSHQQPTPSSQIYAVKERLSMASYKVRTYPDRFALHRYFSLSYPTLYSSSLHRLASFWMYQSSAEGQTCNRFALPSVSNSIMSPSNPTVPLILAQHECMSRMQPRM